MTLKGRTGSSFCSGKAQETEHFRAQPELTLNIHLISQVQYVNFFIQAELIFQI